MGKSISIASWVVGLGLMLAACGGSSKTPPGDTPSSCTVGERVCEGLNIKVCGADGRQTVAETCLPPQSCAEGACTNTGCVPNTRFCKDGDVHKCDSEGAGSALDETCSAAEFCREEDGDAECSDTACTAGEALCDDSIATTCKADGSGPKPGGQDCADGGQVCHQGSCRASACTEGEKVCQHGDVYLCADNGSSTVLLADCEDDEVCDGALGACRPQVCEPGKIDCDSTRIVTCNQYGSGWEQSGSDCTATDELCVAGVCKKQTCTPSATFCEEGDVYRCDADGISSILYQQCDPENYHCESHSGSYASCQYNDCEPGELVCHGAYVKTCTDTGTYPASGTRCADDMYCLEGSCKPRVCEPYTYACKDGDIYYCEYDGRAQYVSEQCISGTTCKQIESGFACVSLPCEAGEKSCLGNKVGTCSSDGSTLSAVTEDCAASSKVCGDDLTCVTSTQDTLGIAEDAETISAGYVIGDAIEMHSARKLVEIEANLVLASARELRWVIYEQSGSNFVARIDKVVSNQSGTGFFSSGPISYTLTAGKRYLVAVAITGGNAIAYYDTKPWNLDLSFGVPLGRAFNYYSPTLYADYHYQERLYQMRLTTELP
jgi:hypothetical protein